MVYMKTKYIKPYTIISKIEISNLLTTGSTIGQSGGNELGLDGIQFAKDRDDGFGSDDSDWNTGLW